MIRAVVAAAAAVGLLAASGAAPSSPTILTNGANVGAFVLQYVDGSVATVAEYRKPLVVVAFARWCTPCMKDLPYVVTAANKYGSRVQFVGIAYNETPAVAEKIVADFHIPFPIEAYDAGSAKRMESATPHPVQSASALPTFPPSATKAQILAILKAHGFKVPAGAEISTSSVSFSLPFAAIVDETGRVRSTVVGYSEANGVYDDGISSALTQMGVVP